MPRAHVFYKGRRASRVFTTKREANRWKQETYAQWVSEAETPKDHRFTLRDALERYRDEIAPAKRGHKWELVRIAAFLDVMKDPHLPRDTVLGELRPDSFAKWRDWRKTRVQAGTVLRELSLLSAVLTAARREWQWMNDNPLTDLRKPKSPDHREVLLTWSQIRAMCNALGWRPGGDIREVRHAVGACMMMALRTGMRAGEICGLEWAQFHGDHCKVRHKTGRTAESMRVVPLSSKAQRIVEQMRGWDERFVFGVEKATLDAMFRKYRKRAGLDGFTFHDTRHTAATMLAPRLDVLTLCKVFGWSNPKQAMVYFNPSASDLAKRLG